MTTVLLVRHGRSSANTAGVLAGRSPGVHLDDRGRRQAIDLGKSLAGIAMVEAVSSPLERCQETAALLLDNRDISISTDDGLTECDYGEWTNRPLSELAKEPLWAQVQGSPSAVTFPGGESMTAMAARGIAALLHNDRRIADRHGDQAIWLAVSHGDVIKSIAAHGLGMHLDHFQRISVSPAALSILSVTDGALRTLTLNAGSDLSALVPRGPVTEGTVGGDIDGDRDDASESAADQGAAAVQPGGPARQPH